MQSTLRHSGRALAGAMMLGAMAHPAPAQSEGYWDLFVVSLSPVDYYWNQAAGGVTGGTLNDPLVSPDPAGVGVVDPATPLGGVAWAFGGYQRGDGVRNEHPAQPTTTISLRGESQYYLSAVLDTMTPPLSDNNYPSYGVIILKVDEIRDGASFGYVVPAGWGALSPDDAPAAGTEVGMNFPLLWVNLGWADIGEGEFDTQAIGVHGTGGWLPVAGDGNGDPSDDGYDVEILTDLMATWDAYAIAPCAPSGAPYFVETYEVVGDANNTPWSWRIRSTGSMFEDLEDLNVPGVADGGSALDVAEAFAGSINAARDARGCSADQINAQARDVFGTVILSVTTGDSAMFELYVGAALSDPDCLVGTGLPACNFNPSIQELTLPGDDCNGNGFDDFIDILAGDSRDTNNNGIPDECECPADFNGDGTVDSRDFTAFLNAFTAGDPAADFNGDGTINSRDFTAFLNAFVAGC